jgi:hypothetical protein
MPTPRQAANTAVGILILGSLAYCGYAYATAEQRVRALCAEITPEMSIDSLRSVAASHGMTYPSHDSGVNYLVESRTFGRYGCRVDTENGVVKRSAFSTAD